MVMPSHVTNNSITKLICCVIYKNLRMVLLQCYHIYETVYLCEYNYGLGCPVLETLLYFSIGNKLSWVSITYYFINKI